MSEGIKIPVVVPWSLVAMAALGLAFMYRDVQHMKEQLSGGVSPAVVARLEARLDGQNTRVNDVVERVGRIERSNDWQRRREEERPR